MPQPPCRFERVCALQEVDALGDDLNDFLTQCANAADELIDDDALIDGDALGKLETILNEAGLQETAPADPY